MVESCVEVRVQGFNGLQEMRYPLALDNYQRSYVWDDSKVSQLCQDFLDYQSLGAIAPDYYLGTLLLHRNHKEKRYFVIDGQQRLTSLLVLFHVLNKGKSKPINNFKFCYRSILSASNIQKAKVVFDEKAKNRISSSIFNHLAFTVIVVEEEDLAFNFFDTQNNRGVQLGATDLLKAFHLRAIKGDVLKDQEVIQANCAIGWEKAQKIDWISKKNKNGDFAPELFYDYLWRARCWKGNSLKRESYNDVLNIFQDLSLAPLAMNHIPLYRGNSNRLADSMSFLNNSEYRLNTRALEITSHPSAIPFSIRQPIHQGVGFFLYAKKYNALIRLIFTDEVVDLEILRYRIFYNEVIKNNSLYLQEIYKLATLMYFDQFGSASLLRFVLHLDHLLGAVRLNKHYIFREAPLIFLRESSQNILDVIANAYRPEEIIEHLISMGKIAELKNEGYSTERVKDLAIGEGVRGRYLQSLFSYYGKRNLQEKANWMDEHYTRAEYNG